MLMPPPIVSARSTSDAVTRCVIGRSDGEGTGAEPIGVEKRIGIEKTRSAVRRTLATPPPATKNGSIRAALVGMRSRTAFEKTTMRPPRFVSAGDGKNWTIDGRPVVAL